MEKEIKRLFVSPLLPLLRFGCSPGRGRSLFFFLFLHSSFSISWTTASSFPFPAFSLAFLIFLIFIVSVLSGQFSFLICRFSISILFVIHISRRSSFFLTRQERTEVPSTSPWTDLWGRKAKAGVFMFVPYGVGETHCCCWQIFPCASFNDLRA